MMDSTFSRRRFIQKNIFQALTILGVGGMLNGCDQKQSTQQHDTKETGPDPCNNLSALSEKDLDARKKLGYVKESPIAEKTCDKCKLWLPPAAGKQCGGCMLFKGPVYTAGYCTYWAALDG